MPVATLVDAPRFESGAITFRTLATPSRGTTELTTWRAELAPHSSSGLHSLDREQLMVVGEGGLVLLVDGERVVGAVGDVLILPAGSDLELRNETDDVAAAVVISPIGFTATAGGHTFSPPWSL